MSKVNILLSCAGRRVELMQSLREDARALGLEAKIIATDLYPQRSPACHLADLALQSPKCTDPSYISHMQNICKENEIDILIPTIDTELLLYARSQNSFETTKIVISEPTAVEIARSKLLTATTLSHAGIPTPASLLHKDFLENESALKYPIIVKKIDGSSSVGLYICRSKEELPEVQPENFVAQELITGTEYTINCYVDTHGQLVAAVPHQRLETRSGEVNKAVTKRVDTLTSIARQIVEVIPGFRGPFCFQAIIDASGTPFVFEINARFGGGYPVARHAGAPFTQWILEEFLEKEVSGSDNWESETLMLRYDMSVFTKDVSDE